jgi:galactofuranose transport system ATP-binding protein
MTSAAVGGDDAVHTADEADGGVAPAGGALLEVRAVDKSFAGVKALEGVDFAAHAGRVHALVGENGAGKSTLIKVFTGVHRPDAGEVRLAGGVVHFAAPIDAQHAGISTIYQEVNLVPLMTVAQNLFLGREPRRFGLIDHGEMRRRAGELLRSYGIEVDGSRMLRTLGLGLQQMVAVVRAVSIDARVVVMDEPTSSLEPREVDQLLELVRSLSRRGIAVVYVSHKMDELFRVCDDVTVLRDGHVVHTGQVSDLTRGQLVSHMLGRDAAELQRLRAEASHQVAEGEEPLLRVLELSRTAQLSGVSFEVRPGEVVGLGGLLGSGRTETVKAIAGALPLDSGRVKVDGRTLRSGSTPAAVRSGVAMLPEDRKAEGIIPDLSVRDNIVLAALPRLGRGGLVSDEKVDAVVETFMKRLRIKASGPQQKVRDLSGGNQQKVVLARWLCTQPKVLLLDEPTRGIDVGAKTEVQALVAELAHQGLAIVLVTSEMEELVGGSSRIVVLHEGAAVAELAGDQVTEQALMAALAHGGGDA